MYTHIKDKKEICFTPVRVRYFFSQGHVGTEVLLFLATVSEEGRGGTDLVPSTFSDSNTCAIVMKPSRNTQKLITARELFKSV